jgi:hypothetical protein
VPLSNARLRSGAAIKDASSAGKVINAMEAASIRVPPDRKGPRTASPRRLIEQEHLGFLCEGERECHLGLVHRTPVSASLSWSVVATIARMLSVSNPASLAERTHRSRLRRNAA